MSKITNETEITSEETTLYRSQDERRSRIEGIVIGLFVGFGDSGHPLVIFHDNPKTTALPAKSIAKLSPDDIGSEIALLFEEGDPARPLIIGPVQRSAEAELTAAELPCDTNPVAKIDGERVVLSATQEIVLQCGKGSITLTAAGKIIVRGTYLLNYSSGVNRIKGGSVQIN